MIDFELIGRAALARAESLLPNWLPDGKMAGARMVEARNPRRTDAHPGSFSINRVTGRWGDFALADVGGGDLVSLFGYLNNLRNGEAARQLAAELRLSGHGHNGNGGGPGWGAKPALKIEELAQAKGLPLDFLRNNGVEQSGRFVKFGYFNHDRTPAQRYRLRQALTGPSKAIWNRGSDRIGPYSLETPRPDHGSLNLLEGETDTLTAVFHGHMALGLPGASTARLIESEHLAGFDEVLIYQEPDAGGLTFRSGVLKRLSALGFRGRVKVINMPAAVKDLNGLHCRWRGEPGAFERELQRLIDAAEIIRIDTQPSKTPQRPQIEIVDGQLPWAVDRAQAILAQHHREAGVYERGDVLVRVATIQEGTSKKIRRGAGGATLSMVTPVLMVDTLTRLIDFGYQRKADWESKNCPTSYAQTIISRGVGAGQHHLHGIIEAPILRPDGSVLLQPGYDLALKRE